MEVATQTAQMSTPSQNVSTEPPAKAENSEKNPPSGQDGKSVKQALPPKKWVLKDNDITREVEREEDLVTLAQRGLNSERKYQQAAQIRRGVDDIINSVKDKDKKKAVAALSKLVGSDEALEELASAFLLEKIEYNSLSPLERENLQLKREQEETKREREQREAGERAAAAQADNDRAAQEIDQEIGQVLKTLGRDASPRLILRIAEDMLAHLSQEGGKRPNASESLTSVMGGLEQDVIEYLTHTPVKDLIKVLPKQVRDALRQQNIADVESPFATVDRREEQTAEQKYESSKPKARRQSSTDNWFKTMDNKFLRKK